MDRHFSTRFVMGGCVGRIEAVQTLNTYVRAEPAGRFRHGGVNPLPESAYLTGTYIGAAVDAWAAPNLYYDDGQFFFEYLVSVGGYTTFTTGTRALVGVVFPDLSERSG